MHCATCESPLAGSAAALCTRCALMNALALGGASTPSLPPTEKNSGPTVEGYQALYELGRGSMGVVWLARDTALGRLVALKLIAAGADPRFGPRLLREGRAIAKLRHPHIVAVHALGEAGETTFLAMDFIAGGDLQMRLQNKPLAPRAAAALVRKIADALAHAHAAGVLHRDLKPSNILLDDAGEPHLADFGLAAPLSGTGDLTAPGQVAGTPGFLAPELVGGTDRASPHSDIYGLGAVLYACLTGRAPFVGESTAAILAQLVEGEPPPPHWLNPAVPHDLETICLKCLEKFPARRYARAEDLRDDIDRFERNQPIAARPVGHWEKGLRWCRRKPAFATVSALSAVLVLVLAIGGPITAWRMARAREAAETAKENALTAGARTREQLRAALLARSRATRLTGRQGQRSEALAASEEAARIRPGLDARNEVIAALALPDLALVREWPLRANARHAVSFAPDHDRYAVAIEAGRIELHRLADGSLLRTFDGIGAAPLVGPVFSPDGRRIVIRDAQARVVTWQDDHAGPAFVLEDRHYLLGGSIAGYGQPDAFSPDGRVLASAFAGGVSLHATEDGHELRRIATDAEPSHVAFSPNGHLLAVGRGLSAKGGSDVMFVQVFETGSGAELVRLPTTANFQTLAWSNDSASILVGGHLLEVYEARSGRRLRVISDPRATRGIFGADDTIITTNQGGGVTLWDPSTARPLLSAALGGQPEIAIDREGSLIAKAAAERGRLYQLKRSSVVRSIPAKAIEGYGNVTNNGGAALDYSPDGRWLVTAVWGAVQLRDALTGRVLDAASLGTSNNHCGVRFAPDGASLLTGSRELGVVRLPIVNGPDGAPRIGPRETLDAETGFVLADLTHDGRRAALVSMWRGEVKVVALDGGPATARWNLAGAGRAIFLPNEREVLANSTEAMGRAGLTLHDSTTGLEGRTLAQTRGYHVRMSGDRRWVVLGTGANESALVHADDWRAGPQLPPELQGAGKNAALSHDGTWLAVATGPQISLVRTADGAVVALLDTPQCGSYAPDLAFSPDGAHLAVCWENGLLTIWDLQTLRRELAARGLDW